MNYKKVDFSTWPRGDLFQFYMDHMRVVMSLTVDMDVTPLVRFVKQRGMKFYPAMIWVVSRVINVHEEFKLGWDQDGNLIRWDFVSPSYAHFHPEDGNFTKLVTPYRENLLEFHAFTQSCWLSQLDSCSAGEVPVTLMTWSVAGMSWRCPSAVV